MSAGGSKRAVIAALLANLGIAVLKFAAFVFTRSSAMLAEAVHSLADTGNQILLIFGGKRSQRDPTPIHPFGYARERYFWSFVVSIVLFTMGALFAIFEGVEKIIEPHELDSPAWAIATLLGAMVLEGFSFRTVIRESSEVRGSATWPQFVRRAKIPELPIVLLEDFAALIGLTLALIAIALVMITGNPVWDGYGTVAIGLLLGVIATTLAIEMKSLLIGEAADPDEEAKIDAAIRKGTYVRDLIYLRTQHFGPEELLVAAKVEFDPSLSVAELAAAIDAVELDIRAAVPTSRHLFIEPDVRRAAIAAADPDDTGDDDGGEGHDK